MTRTYKHQKAPSFKLNISSKINYKIICLLSFLIPLSTMLGCMIYFEVEPFGDHSFMIIDALHQYLPFFSILYDKLKEGGSLFYSFRTGLGINFLSLFSYYLSSPFNLLILLFSKNQLNMAICFIFTLKIALCGLTSSIYFRSKDTKGEHHMLTLALSVAYALNSYIVGYSWNIMWLDAIMIFPIILLGIDRLVDHKDGRLYCIALFYALYCNYYIAFMICIFSVLWYLLHSFKDLKQFFLRGIAFTFYSFLAAGLSAILLIPAYMGIKQTASGDEMGLPTHSWLTSFWDLINRQIDLTSPLTHDNFDGNANLYFGMFTVLIIFLYIFHHKIPIFQKIKRILLIVFFYISFNEEILNFIWHGFHNQYGIPNRFSFLYGFVLLIMVYELFEYTDTLKLWHVLLATSVSIGLIVLCRTFASTPLKDSYYVIAGVLVLLYAIVLFLLAIDRTHKKYYVGIFSLIMIVEMIATGVNGFDLNGQIDTSKFFYGTEEMNQLTTEAKERTDLPFYRSELADYNIVDENAWYNLNAIGLFGSTAMSHTVDLMDNLGFYTGCNEYLYKGATPLTNLMFGVKYLYYHTEDDLQTDFNYVDGTENFSLYENSLDGLSIGYTLDQYIDNWNYETCYPFIVLNDFSYQGYDYDPIFEQIEIPDPDTTGCTVTANGDGEYRFDFEEVSEDNIVFTISEVSTTAPYYIFYDGTQVENTIITVDGEVVRSGDLDGAMQYIGQVTEGSTITISMKLKGEDEVGYIRLSAAVFRNDNFAKLANTMAERALHITSMNDTHITGSVDVIDNQYLFFSIPYDEGWTVTVDGQEVETFAIGEAFLGAPVNTGTHYVELSYTPPGFSVGWKISLVSLLIVLALFFLPGILSRRRKKRRRKRKPSPQTESNTDAIESQG